MWRRSTIIRLFISIGALSVVASLANAAISGSAQDLLPPPIPGEIAPKSPATTKPAEPRAGRGQLLYENHCTECHTSVAHVRNDRRARTLKELEAWVMRWAGQRQLDWDTGDVAEVVMYLNQRYYHFTPDGPTR